MLRGLTILLICQFVGEVASQALALPVPGPVLGLLLLLILLILRGGPDESLKATSNGLLRHLAMLFVPASVGIITQLDALRQNWLPVTVAILLSTVIGLGVTGWIMQRLLRDPA